jgi:hypothetical protein
LKLITLLKVDIRILFTRCFSPKKIAGPAQTYILALAKRFLWDYLVVDADEGELEFLVVGHDGVVAGKRHVMRHEQVVDAVLARWVQPRVGYDVLQFFCVCVSPDSDFFCVYNSPDSGYFFASASVRIPNFFASA